MRGCSSVAKWMQTSTQWSSDEMDTLKKCEKKVKDKTSQVSAHRESIHHLNSHQWHLITTGSYWIHGFHLHMDLWDQVLDASFTPYICASVIAWKSPNQGLLALATHMARKMKNNWSSHEMLSKVGPPWRFKMPDIGRMDGTTHLGIHDNEFVWRSLLLVLGSLEELHFCKLLICCDACHVPFPPPVLSHCLRQSLHNPSFSAKTWT